MIWDSNASTALPCRCHDGAIMVMCDTLYVFMDMKVTESHSLIRLEEVPSILAHHNL